MIALELAIRESRVSLVKSKLHVESWNNVLIESSNSVSTNFETAIAVCLKQLSKTIDKYLSQTDETSKEVAPNSPETKTTSE